MQCPNCGSELKLRDGKWGKFWGCPNYASCGFKGQKYEGVAVNTKKGIPLPSNEPVLEALRKVYGLVKEGNDAVSGLYIEMEEIKEIKEGIKEIREILKKNKTSGKEE